MKVRSETTREVRIYMAGDVAAARMMAQKLAATKGMCVTITPTTYVYSGGSEEGFIVGFINYPRFPKNPEILDAEAMGFAKYLMIELGQYSFSVVTPETTTWVSRREETS